MVAFSVLISQFFLCLFLQLHQLNSFVITGQLVVLLSEYFPLMGVKFISFGWIFQFSFYFSDLCLLQLWDEAERLHGQILIVVSCISLESGIDSLFLYWFKDGFEFFRSPFVDTYLFGCFFVLLITLFNNSFFLNFLRLFYLLGGLACSLFCRVLKHCLLFEYEFVRHIF